MTREPESQERDSFGNPPETYCLPDCAPGCDSGCELRRRNALHNARLAPQDAGERWHATLQNIVQREGDNQAFQCIDAEQAQRAAGFLNSLITGKREAEQERDSALQREASSVKGMHKYRQERVAAEARVTALEAELEQLRPRAAKYREGLQVISLMSNWHGDDLETARINAQGFMLAGDALPPSQGEGA